MLDIVLVDAFLKEKTKGCQSFPIVIRGLKVWFVRAKHDVCREQMPRFSPFAYSQKTLRL